MSTRPIDAIMALADTYAAQWANGYDYPKKLRSDLQKALEAALEADKAQQVAVPEPVNDFDVWFANPYSKVLMKSIEEDYLPKREPLSEEQIYAAIATTVTEAEPFEKAKSDACWQDVVEVVRAIEAAHGITQGVKP